MSVYVDDWGVEAWGHGWYHVIADLWPELEAFHAEQGFAMPVVDPGEPWAYVEVTESERLAAIWAGAKPVPAPEAWAEVKRRRAVAAAPAPGPAAGHGPTLARRSPSLHELFAGQDPDLPAGTFVCVRTSSPARWNPNSPRHAWEDPKEHWHRCAHCGVLYRSVPHPAARGKWIKEWEYPNLWGATTVEHPFPRCPGPSHPNKPTP